MGSNKSSEASFIPIKIVTGPRVSVSSQYKKDNR
jgi:hypothetical protein